MRRASSSSAADFQISGSQIDGLGDELVGSATDPGIVQVDTEHYGAIGLADPTDPASDALVVLAYNIVDGAYYDCEASQYTVGYFAPQFIDEDGMNVIVVDTENWDELVGNTNTTDLTIEGVIAHELQHLLHNYSDPGELSWVDEGLADFAIFLNGYPTGGSHSTYHQVFHARRRSRAGAAASRTTAPRSPSSNTCGSRRAATGAEPRARPDRIPAPPATS